MSSQSCISADSSLELASRFGIPSVPSKSEFYDPVMMDSSMLMPRSLETFWDYAFHLFYINGNYRHAWHRLGAYFATAIAFSGKRHGDDDEQDALSEHLIDKLDIMGHAILAAMEVGAYGNSLITYGFPFDRVLLDMRGRLPKSYAIEALSDLGDVRYHWKDMLYEVVDPRDANKATAQRRRIKLPFRDRPSRNADRFRIERLDVRDMHLITSASEHSTQYVRRFAPEFIRKVQDGDAFFVHDVPMSQLAAVSSNQDYLYNEGDILHLKMPTIRGLRNNGWGIPETFANFRHLHHIQTLRRIDEAVGKDYLLPFRLWVPDPDADIADMSKAEFAAFMRQAISDHRKDPVAMHAVPMPVSLIEAGMNGKSLVQAESIEYHVNSLLGASGLPVELYSGSMNVQNIPPTLRLFESTWQFMYYGLNKLVRMSADGVQDVKRASRLNASLKKSSLADDIEERSIYLSLVAGGEISRARGYGALNIDDPVEEKKKRMREDLDVAREQLLLQKQMQQETTAGSIGAGGQPGAPGASPTAGYGNAPGGTVTPIDAGQEATQKAQVLIQMPTGDRMKELAKLRATDPNGMYPLVKDKLDQLRAEGERMGRQAVSQPSQ